MALGSFPLALRGAELLVLDKLKAGSKFTWCRYGAATLQLSLLLFPSFSCTSSCLRALRLLLFKSIALSVLWLPDNCAWTGTSACSCLWLLLSCCNAPSAAPPAVPVARPSQPSTSPACKQPYFSGRCWAAVQCWEFAVESSSFKRWGFPPMCLAFATKLFLLLNIQVKIMCA